METETLRKVLGLANAVNDECVFEFTEKGLRVPVDDPANISFAEIALSSSGFNRYEVTEQSFGVDIGLLLTGLKHVDGDEGLVQLSYEHGTGNRVLEVDAGSQHFEFRTYDPREYVTETPSLDFDTSAILRVPGREFTTAVQTAAEFSEHIVIFVNEEDRSLVMRGEGDINVTKRTIEKNEIDEVEFGPASGVYSLSYLTDICDSIDDNATVHIHLGEEERPMKLYFTFAKGHGEFDFAMGPKI